MANEDPGILGQYGLDLNEQDIADQNRLVGMKMAQMQSQGLGANGYTGALFGNMLAAKNKGLTDDQQAKIAVTRAAQEGMAKWSNMNPTADANTQQLQYKKLLATAAFQNGLPEVGAQILSDVDKSQLMRDRQQAELKKLNLDNYVGDRTKDYDVATKAIEAGKAAHVEAYLVGSRDPNNTISGVFDPATGDLRTSQGVIPAGQWKMTRPEWDPVRTKLAGEAGGGIGTKVGTEEQRKLRDSMQSVGDLMYKTVGIDKMFNEMYKNGTDPAQAMDFTGKAQSFANRWVNTATDLARAFSPDDKTLGKVSVVTQDKDWKGAPKPGREFNLDDASDRQAYAQQNIDYVRSILPANLAKNAQYADRYASMVVDLAYATARAAEPGAKALTDADFKHAMATIGGALNDPTTLRKLLFTRAMTSADSLDRRFRMYSPAEREAIVGKDGWSDYRNMQDELRQRIGFNPDTGEETGTSYPMGARSPGNPARQPMPAPDKDGWTTMPNGARVRAK